MSDEPTSTDPAAEPPKPPWGEDFDAEKAWKLIENLREDNKKRTSTEVLKLQKQLDDLKPLADRAKALEDEKKSDLERLTEQLTAAKASVRGAHVAAIRGEIKSMAAASFADPEDAAAFLDAEKYMTGEGQYDPQAIETDLADLLKRKPHLSREAPRTPRTPAPDPSQGSSGRSQPAAGTPREIFANTIQRMLAEQ